MAEALDTSALRWRQQPISFIEQVLRDPETSKPFELFDAQKQFFAHAWQTNEGGRLIYRAGVGAIKSQQTGRRDASAHHDVFVWWPLRRGLFASSGAGAGPRVSIYSPHLRGLAHLRREARSRSRALHSRKPARSMPAFGGGSPGAAAHQ
jgi:hypothetical protein